MVVHDKCTLFHKNYKAVMSRPRMSLFAALLILIKFTLSVPLIWGKAACNDSSVPQTALVKARLVNLQPYSYFEQIARLFYSQTFKYQYMTAQIQHTVSCTVLPQSIVQRSKSNQRNVCVQTLR